MVKDIASVINENAVKKLFRYNNFPGMTKIPTIVPSEVESPSLKEIGDYIRATGLNALNDPEVMNYLKDIAGIPNTGTEGNVSQGKGQVGQADYNSVYYGG